MSNDPKDWFEPIPDDFEPPYIPWPESRDRLFTRTGTGHDAPLTDDQKERLHHLVNGYKMSGDILVEYVEQNPGFKRRLVYPILFSYRHYLELALKRLVIDYGTAAGVMLEKKDHGLIRLWELFLKILIHHGHYGESSSNDAPTNLVGDRIKEFNSLDPVSQTFRYPSDRLNAPFSSVPSSIDLSEHKRVIENISVYLEAAHSALEPWYG